MADVLPPRANPRLFDQTEAEAVLLRAAQSGRLPHAWLLTGPRGVGKATLAFRFARYLLANPQGEESGLFGAPAAPTSAPWSRTRAAPRSCR